MKMVPKSVDLRELNSHGFSVQLLNMNEYLI